MPYFVAVHVGAGYHSPDSVPFLKALMMHACKAAETELKAFHIAGSVAPSAAFAAVTTAIRVLEVLAVVLYLRHSE